jgi:hypothetical protein
VERLDRRCAAALGILCLAAATSQSQAGAPGIAGAREEREFGAGVAREVHQAMPRNPRAFQLAVADASAPAFPGEATNAVVQVECERLAAYRILGYGNDQGSLAVAACNDQPRLRDLAIKARGRVDAALESFLAPEQLRAVPGMGWHYAREVSSDGSESYYFPVIAVGHGVLSDFTAIYLDKALRRAVVVQVSPEPMCGSSRPLYAESPLCTDLEATLKRLAKAIAQQPFAQN